MHRKAAESRLASVALLECGHQEIRVLYFANAMRWICADESQAVKFECNRARLFDPNLMPIFATPGIVWLTS
jgi:hypothetical protein